MVYVTLGLPPDAVRIQMGGLEDAHRLIDFLAMRIESFSVTIERAE